MKVFVHPVLLLLMLAVLPISCSDNPSSSDGSGKPCPQGTGLYAYISGGSSPLGMCVLDDLFSGQNDIGVNAAYSVLDNRYLISASLQDNNAIHEIILSFKLHSSLPAVLTATANDAEANSDPMAVLFIYNYQELAPGGSSYRTVSASGTMTVSFNDSNTAKASFSGISLLLEDIGNPSDTIARVIDNGFIDISSDP